MGKIIKDTIHANGIDIGIYTQDFENEFISLTDVARYKSDDPTAVIQNWMRNRDVIDFWGLWERLHNPDFKPLEFEGFRKQAGANAFTMSRQESEYELTGGLWRLKCGKLGQKKQRGTTILLRMKGVKLGSIKAAFFCI